MRRSVWIAAVVGIVAAGCGGGGGGGGFAPGPLYWGVPFVAATPDTGMVVGLRNLDTATTTATLQGYKPDGTAYPGPVFVTLDGTDEHRLALTTALGGATPEGGWILASTPSRAVEVYFSDLVDAKFADEAARAIGLDDLAGPLLPVFTGANVTTETTGIQIANVTGVPVTVTVTPFETALDPLDPPLQGADVLVALAAFESKLFLPGDLTGTPWTTGSLQLSAATPFFVAGIEDLAYDATPNQVSLETRFVEVSRAHAGISFGRLPSALVDFVDFAMIARNDSDETEAVTILGIFDPQGVPVIPSPRVVQVPPHASRTMTTLDAPFADVFGDVFLAPTVRDLHIELEIGPNVDVTFRQFDPLILAYNATVRPSRAGFVVDAMDVLPNPLATPDLRTFATILNPASGPIDVVVSALVPEPDGFDATPVPLGTFLVPAHGRVDVSPDGVEFLDRDLFPVDYVGLRFTSNISFAVTGVRQRRAINDLVISLSPLVVRPHENAE